jgi:uncharacterized protein DUF4389
VEAQYPSPPSEAPPAYPVRYSVDYPDRDLNRLTSAFRLFTVIPIAIVAGTVGGGALTVTAGHARYGAAGAGGLLFLGPLLMILFRKKYPRWWFDWNLELLRLEARVGAYFALMSDVYPSTDEHQYIQLDIDYPDAERDLGRGMPLVKWLLAIPHYVVLIALYVGAIFAVIGAWFAILFTGRFPRGLFDYLVGVGRWHNRVVGYALMLATDQYPPFRLSP